MISFDSIFSTVTGLLAAAVAYLAYRLQVRTKDQEWYEDFNNLYSEFWNDTDIVAARSWIACSDAYSKIEKILKQRLETGEVSASEYSVLEKIDKFCSLMIRISELTPDVKNEKYKSLLKKLYFDFWIEKLKERKYLYQYIDELWPGLLEVNFGHRPSREFLAFSKILKRNKKLHSTK